jgi:hypothetical protein
MSTVLDHLEAAAAKRLGSDNTTVVSAAAGLTAGQRPVYADDVIAFLTVDDPSIDGIAFGKPVAPGGPPRRANSRPIGPVGDGSGIVRIRTPKEFAAL